ncbi:MAG: YkgJ family cysteine cluster protein [bacterium]|nr:YkgJ family cysteine cluster protein [bacterium]
MTQPESPKPHAPPQDGPKQDPRWYRDGLCFSCTACGNCCTSNGEYAYVYVTPPEIQAIASHLGMTKPAFQAKYCLETDGWITLSMPDSGCVFLDAERRCQIYEARPRQCRTWPFWQENLKPGVWQGSMKVICPGLDTGPRTGADQIDAIAQANEDWYDSNGGLD